MKNTTSDARSVTVKVTYKCDASKRRKCLETIQALRYYLEVVLEICPVDAHIL